MKKSFIRIVSSLAFVGLLTCAAAAKEITIRGRLARTVEAGGWLIITGTGEGTDKYLLLNAKRFRNESWFRVGAEVEATGETKSDVMTIYQEGTPFEARTMRSIKRKRATAGGRRRAVVSHPEVHPLKPPGKDSPRLATSQIRKRESAARPRWLW